MELTLSRHLLKTEDPHGSSIGVFGWLLWEWRLGKAKWSLSHRLPWCDLSITCGHLFGSWKAHSGLAIGCVHQSPFVLQTQNDNCFVLYNCENTSFLVDDLCSPAVPRVLLAGRGRFCCVKWKIVTWLILPVVICLSQRLSHACLSINNSILWNCEWLIKSVKVYLIIPYYLDNRSNSRANTC